MKKILLLFSLLTLLIASAQQQDTLYVWKAGVLVNIQSIKPADMDSITFKRPFNSTGINIPGPSVTDIDGNIYASVTNCGLTFTKQNLNVSRYTDGTPIPQVTDPTQWANLTTGAWCYYENNSINGPTYGKLYNWYAVAGIYNDESSTNPALRKKLAPTGWHIPSDTEWTQFTNCLGGADIAGGKMKSTGIIEFNNGGIWHIPNFGASNESGFTGLPGGYRQTDSIFSSIGFYGHWWSSTEVNTSDVWYRQLNYNNPDSYAVDRNKKDGISVRCIKD
jgi:uncharacterized protein (TIGR02145 family)